MNATFPRSPWPQILLLVCLAVIKMDSATVTWDGGGGDRSWQNALNWSDDAVPSPFDEVVIAGSLDGPIVCTNSVWIGSLDCGAALVISNQGQLRIERGVSRIGGPLTITSRGLVTATETNTTLIVAGPLQIAQGGLAAQRGAQVTVTGWNTLVLSDWADLVVTGPGSRLACPGLAHIEAAAGTEMSVLRAIARGGGHMDLSEVQAIDGAVDFEVTGPESALDLSALTRLSIRPTKDFQSLVMVGLGARLQLPRLSEVESSGGLRLRVAGTGSLLLLDHLSGLTVVEGTAACVASADAGGTLRLSSLRQIEGPLQIVANGAASQIELSGEIGRWTLPGDDPGFSITATSGGLVRLRQLAALEDPAGKGSVEARGSGSLVDLSGLELLIGGPSQSVLRIQAASGGQVNLSRLSLVEGDVQIMANGSSSLIDLSASSGQWRAHDFPKPGGAYSNRGIFATGGGTVKLPNWTLLDASWASVVMSADGPGSVVDASGLSELRGGTNGIVLSLAAQSGGTLKLGAVRQSSGDVRVSADGAESRILAPESASAWRLLLGAGRFSLDASGGGAIQATRLEWLDASAGQVSVEAFGSGSLVALAGLTAVTGDLVSFDASGGSRIDLQHLERLSGNRVSVGARGSGSVVNLEALNTFISTLTNQNGWPVVGGQVGSDNGGTVQFSGRGMLLASCAIWNGMDEIVRAEAGLSLYGRAGQSYLIETRDLSSPGNPWTLWQRVPLGDTLERIADLPPSNLALRVREWTADPPVIELGRTDPWHLRLVLYGTPGKTYALEFTDRLPAEPGSWVVESVVTLTHTFHVLPSVLIETSDRFFRLREP